MTPEIPEETSFPNNFAHYPPPKPTGIPLPPNPTFHKPLLKMMKQIAKPPKRPVTRHTTRSRLKNRKHKFY